MCKFGVFFLPGKGAARDQSPASEHLVGLHCECHTSKKLDTASVMMQWYVSNQDWEPTALQKKKKRTEQGTMFQQHFMRTALTNQQVHMTDQVTHPQLWNSFGGTGIHNGRVPPAKQVQVLLLLRRSTHIHT